MGEQKAGRAVEENRRRFMRQLLEDLDVLQQMLPGPWFERNVRRMGAEMEMFLVDRQGNPANIAQTLLANLDDPRFTPELGLFNLEANLTPQRLQGQCLRVLEQEIDQVLGLARHEARAMDHDVVLCGILPSLKRENLGLDSMTPAPRYRALNETLRAMRGSDFSLQIKGIDQLEMHHDNLMLEACNTSFQVHFQVAPEEFASLYNLAQLVSAPLLAMAANSPLLLAKRLWQETRIAVFEHSIDTRSTTLQERGQQPRVHFGSQWVRESVTEIFQEDIARFRVVLGTDGLEDARSRLSAGEVPRLQALCLHNGTVYRWNRACYGVADGKAHLRIENRILPAGPTVLDQVANAAFYFGLLSNLSVEVEDLPARMDFSDARANFFTAAREGMRAQLMWLDGEYHPAGTLILDELLPRAREGLARLHIDAQDIERYLGVVQARVESRQTGAKWQLEAFNRFQGGKGQATRSMVLTMAELQKKGQPVHQWPAMQEQAFLDSQDNYRTVAQLMTTDLFSVHPDDLVDFAASLMDWRHIRHVPVEDDSGNLVGLISHRALLRMVARPQSGEQAEAIPVRDIMSTNPVTVTPDTPTVEAIQLMRSHQVACLPVVRDGKLVGIVSERDLIEVSGRLLEQWLQEDG